MSFVPLTGPATFHPAEPLGDSTVEFSDDRRTVALPLRAAIRVLGRARATEGLHPTVGMLAGSVLLGLRLTAAGRIEPAAAPARWLPVLEDADLERIRALGALVDDADAGADVVRRVVTAVVDTLPAAAPSRPARRGFSASLHQRLADRLGADDRDLPHLVTVSLRIEADEDELVSGAVRLVLQVHDERDPLHLCDAAVLFTEGAGVHGFGSRARVHALMALRRAADAWPVLDRLQALAVPDEITLDGLEIESLLETGIPALADLGVDVMWPRSLGRELTARAVLDRVDTTGRPYEEPLETGVLSAGAAFAFQWQVALDGDPLTPEEMHALTTAASPVIRLRGQWMVVPPDVARRARRRLASKVRPAQALAATLTGRLEVETHDDKPAEVVVGASLLRVRERLLTARTREPVEVPAGLAASLRDYQRAGFTWLSEVTGLGLGACLADDMGLGKTVTLIALHLHRVAQGPAAPTLVVAPTSLLGNWEDEIRRFAPGVPVRRFHGSGRDLTGLTDGFVLTTYGTMRTSAMALAQVRWGMVVADEAQHVKNERTATARALRSIPHGVRVGLTGTPIENDLTELWAILDWCIPGLLGSRNAFRKAWAAPIEAGVDPALTRRFADLISPFLLRRRKSDPGIAPELPPKTETDHPLGLTREQVVLYESLVRDTMERIQRADPESRRGLVLMLLTGLKQICNHPAQFLKQANPRLAGRSRKLEAVDEIVTTVVAEGGALLLFTQYVEMGRLLERHFTAAGVAHQFLHGGSSVREREEMVRAFQAGPEGGGPPVFILSLRAGGTGLNLTRADHVVHVDLWWNPAVEEQATDRAHRIGQTRPVQVHRLITRGTVEERVTQLLERKRSLAESVLGRGETALTELSDDELRDLVTLRLDDES